MAGLAAGLDCQWAARPFDRPRRAALTALPARGGLESPILCHATVQQTEEEKRGTVQQATVQQTEEGAPANFTAGNTQDLPPL